jgi:proliferating cell nuclear antigen
MNENKPEFAGIIDYTILKEVLSALVGVTDRGVLRISEEGITSKQVDPANVAMVSLDMKRDVFTDYDLKGEELVAGVDFDKLLHNLKLYNYLTNVEEHIEIKIDTKRVQMNSGYFSYDLQLIPLDALRKEPKLPELEFPATATIKLEDFKLGINIADDITGYVEICMNSEEFFMGMEGNEDKFRLAIPKEDLTLFNVNREVKSRFSTDYLMSMAKGVVGRLITLKTNNDYPLQMQFTVTEGCKVAYLLSPRINQE